MTADTYATQLVAAALLSLRREHHHRSEELRAAGLTELAELEADAACIMARLLVELTGQKPFDAEQP